MVDPAIISTVRGYLLEIRKVGIRASRAILFGSHARGQAGPDSDIDLLIIAPEFDPAADRDLVKQLWRARGVTDSRIEPLAVGETQWKQDDRSAILEWARREGVEIS